MKLVDNNKAFTMVELLTVAAIIAILTSSIGYVFIIGLDIFNQGYKRSGLRSEMSTAMALISKNLKQATSIDALNESSITFTADLGLGSESYRVYLYHDTDAEPNPPYTQNNYELRWAQGSVDYGDGAVLARNIAQPGNIPFSQNNNLITVDLTEIVGEETFRLRSNIRPRNL